MLTRKVLAHIIGSIMLWRVVSLFLLLVIATGNLAASFSFLKMEMGDSCCSKASTSDKKEKQSCSMACCAQGKSPIGSPVAKACCENVCGGHSSDTAGLQFENVRQIPSPCVSSITVSLPSRLLLEYLLANSKFLEKTFPYYQPTELYLQTSALLI